MVDLKVRHRSASLASPAIPLQDFSTKLLIQESSVLEEQGALLLPTPSVAQELDPAAELLSSGDDWIAMCAAVGCCGLLVHSSFNFNLHIPANATWFAVLAGMAITVTQPVAPRRPAASQTVEAPHIHRAVGTIRWVKFAIKGYNSGQSRCPATTGDFLLIGLCQTITSR